VLLQRTALVASTKVPSTLSCDPSTIDGEAYGQSRNHEYLGRDTLSGTDSTSIYSAQQLV
jgi:hypothetical protein